MLKATLAARQRSRFVLLPQEHSVVLRQTSRWGQIFLISLVGLGAAAFATAWLYRLDEVITVQGRLQPQKGGVEVKSPLAGQLAQLMVASGDRVKRGQPILRFDVNAARSEEANLVKQLALQNERLADQLKSNAQRQVTAQRNVQLTTNILNRLKPLERGGAMSEVQILQQSNQLETQRDQLQQLKTERQQLISDSEAKSQEIRGRLEQVRNQLRNEVVLAPISGVVFDLKPDNDRYVAQNAEPLMKIVPGGNLSAQVNVSNQDIGFIKAGLPVKVRVDSFPYTEYGEIPGSVSQVGADALPPSQLIPNYHFPVDIELSRSQLRTKEGKLIPLQSGMTVTTNLKLRDRRLIELLSDLFTSRGESLQRLRQP
jgi:HlyD family secretion protein